MKIRRWLALELALAALLAGAAAANAQKPVDCDTLRRENAQLEAVGGRIEQIRRELPEAEAERVAADDAEQRASAYLEDFTKDYRHPGGDPREKDWAESVLRQVQQDWDRQESEIRDDYARQINDVLRFPDDDDNRNVAALSNRCQQAVRFEGEAFWFTAHALMDDLRQRFAAVTRAHSRQSEAESRVHALNAELARLERGFDPIKLEATRFALAMSDCGESKTNDFADAHGIQVEVRAEQPQGFGDSPEVSVRPTDGTERTILSDATSGDLLTRFNDACSVRNWELAQATLREASRGASWYDTGVQVLQNERERAAEGDQVLISKCYELESAMLAAARRNDWAGAQAFAAQARAAGCQFNAETCQQTQQLWQEACVRERRQQQAQQFAGLLGQLAAAALGAVIQQEITDHHQRHTERAVAPSAGGGGSPPQASTSGSGHRHRDRDRDRDRDRHASSGESGQTARSGHEGHADRRPVESRPRSQGRSQGTGEGGWTSGGTLIPFEPDRHAYEDPGSETMVIRGGQPHPK